MFRRFFVLLGVLLLVSCVVAHLPRLVSEESTSVEDPEVSQAFYGELEGGPHFFRISSEGSFRLYVGVLVPAVEGVDRDVSAVVLSGDEVLFVLNGSSSSWSLYFEEFGGDYYFRGPEHSVDVEAGVYDIVVSSPDNRGRYVLVLGERERFSLGDWVDTVFSLPRLKQDFFDKPWYTAFFNLVGVFLFVFLVVLSVLLYVVYRFLTRRNV